MEDQERLIESQKGELDQEMVKVHDALTYFRIGERMLPLREMKIKRLNEFSEKVFLVHSSLMDTLEKMQGKGEENKNNPVDSMPIVEAVNDEMIGILNFVFNLNGEGTITREWFEENISNRILEMIHNEVVRQNRADWLLPFFGKFYLLSSLQTSVNLIAKKIKDLSGKSTIS